MSVLKIFFTIDCAYIFQSRGFLYTSINYHSLQCSSFISVQIRHCFIFKAAENYETYLLEDERKSSFALIKSPCALTDIPNTVLILKQPLYKETLFFYPIAEGSLPFVLNRNSDKSKLNQRDISPADRATNLFKIRNIFLGLRVGFQTFANGLVNKEFSLERNYVSE